MSLILAGYIQGQEASDELAIRDLGFHLFIGGFRGFTGEEDLLQSALRPKPYFRCRLVNFAQNQILPVLPGLQPDADHRVARLDGVVTRLARVLRARQHARRGFDQTAQGCVLPGEQYRFGEKAAELIDFFHDVWSACLGKA